MTTNINYTEMINHYKNIINSIYMKCDSIEASYWDDEKGNMVYGEEYLNAYGYLQKAEWRLSDISSLKNYYDEVDFHCFGLELLQEVCDRIEHYLNHTQQKHEEIVYTYNKYDDIVNTLFENEYHNKKDFNELFKYYYKLTYFISFKENILSELEFIKSNIKSIEYKVDVQENYGCKNLIEEDLVELKKLTDKIYSKVDDYELNR